MSKKTYAVIFLLSIVVAAYVTADSEESMRRDEWITFMFPEIETRTLSGEHLLLPRDGGKSATVVFLAFERDTQEQIDAWSERLVGVELNPSAAGGPLRITPTGTDGGEVKIFEIPMLKGRWRFLSGVIDGGMRSGIPEAQHPYVATFYGDVDKYRRTLEMKKKSHTYLYILDAEGLIRFAAAGPPTGELVNEAVRTLKELVGGK